MLTDIWKSLYTLGYSGWKPDELRATAEELDALVVDIRFSPNSRNPSFRKGAFEKLLGERYLYLKPCGNENFRGDLGPDIVLADEGVCMSELERLLAQRPLILVCACKQHEGCHRTLVASLLAQRLGLEVVHLYPRATAG